MVRRRASMPVIVALMLATLWGLAGWTAALAGPATAVQPAAAQQADDDPPGMGEMMAAMSEMQAMMGQMMGTMAGGMMAVDVMTDTVPARGMAHGEMGQRMAMMGEMQTMMADMQAMMAEGMMAGGMRGMGEMQHHTMMPMVPMVPMMPMVMPVMMAPPAGGMMAMCPMMSEDMMREHMSAMMEQMGDMGMMGEMPMMQGMGMGDMAHEGAAVEPADDASESEAAAPQTVQLGEIEVKVTPPDLSNVTGETMEFTVDLNATGADLGLDLAELATLRIGDHEMPASSWEVAFDHGHHVNGVLQFPAHVSGAIDSATLVLTDPAGGPDVTLTWPAAE